MLQIERLGNSVGFFVDGQQLPLTRAPNFPACASLSSWGIDFYVWKDGNSVEGYLEQVSER